MIISILKKALHPSYKGRKQAFFYSDLEAFGFHNRPHQHLSSNMIYTNTPFKVGYLPNRLIDLKQLAHMESSSSLAVLISHSACSCI